MSVPWSVIIGPKICVVLIPFWGEDFCPCPSQTERGSPLKEGGVLPPPLTLTSNWVGPTMFLARFVCAFFGSCSLPPFSFTFHEFVAFFQTSSIFCGGPCFSGLAPPPPGVLVPPVFGLLHPARINVAAKIAALAFLRADAPACMLV